MSRKVILYIAMSLDGYIAKKDDDISFLDKVIAPNEDYGYAAFTAEVDTIIWGRRTYEKVLSLDPQYQHKDKSVYVLSNSRTGKDGHVSFVNNLADLVNDLKAKEGKHIYCDGGGQIVGELLKLDLIDELIVSVIPYLLGDGIRLFNDGLPELDLNLLQSKAYPSGLVQLHYARVR